MSNKLTAHEVHVWYGSFHALKNISLTIKPNTVTAFIGPSGCGKSTFLRLFNRMNDYIDGFHMGGEITIDGRNIYGKRVMVEELRKEVGMVFQ
ncbi:MAG TPA: ATP-binding cassette domain-containing protein, partial [Chitinophagales bacterium]|nr:ATP-binding cassette domain-containing protein [Chitinophagales bacterium]